MADDWKKNLLSAYGTSVMIEISKEKKNAIKNVNQ